MKPIFLSDSIIFPFSISHFNICSKYPKEWNIIKLIYIFTYIFNTIIISNSIFNILFGTVSFKKTKEITISKKDNLSLLIGISNDNNSIWVNELGLYQNFLITGTIR